MILDAQLLMSDAQAVTADAVSTNTFDSGAAGDEIGTGEALTLAIGVDVAADFTTGDETYVFSIIQSATANLASATKLVTRTIAASLLTAGSLHFIDLEAKAKTQRYLGVDYDVGGTTPTITVTSWFTLRSMIQAEKTYARGYTVN